MNAPLTPEPATAPETACPPRRLDLAALYRDSEIGPLLAELDRDLVGLAPVKRRIREIAAHLLVTRARRELGLEDRKSTRLNSSH